MSTRQEIALQAAHGVRGALPRLGSFRALIGYDGFVDEIISVVGKRYQLDKFDRVDRISDLAAKIAGAAGESTNIELVVNLVKLGGNGPIMANAMASAGLGVTYVGGVGYPTLHPVFEPMAQRATVHSLSEPGHTDALEFEDGKLMLGKLQPCTEIHWENVKSRIGLETYTQAAAESDLIAAVNWTMLPYLESIWEGLLDEVLPGLPAKPRTFFFDLADPEKRTSASLLHALHMLKRFEAFGKVILGVNLKEANQVASVLEVPFSSATGDDLAAGAEAIRAKLEISCAVVHPRSGAAAAVAGERAYFEGPFVQDPKISTGAGDHFNAGFCLGRVLGLGLAESLAAGTATSGFYVRNAESPTAEQLADFLEDLPEPQLE